MRLYPPAATISRQALGPDKLGGLAVRAGTLVVVSPYVLHRHKLLWDAPDHFVPERFLPENRGGIDRFAYLPFGAGPARLHRGLLRGAGGRDRAGHRMRHAGCLAPGHEVMPVQRVALRSRGGMPMIIRRR